MRVPVSQSAVGSNPTIVTAPVPYGRSAATVRPPTDARTRPAASSPERAGTSFESSGTLPSNSASEDGATSVVVVGR